MDSQNSRLIDRRSVLAATALIAAAPTTVLAQADYPSHAIKFIVPVPPGNMLDAMPRILGDNVPTRTATAVERLEQAGAVVLGKLHMTEFAFIAHHPDTPPARNPWAQDRSPGGELDRPV